MAIGSTVLENEPLLTEVNAAELLRLSARTLQAWRSCGVGPTFIRAGRAIRYRRGDLLAWIEANAVVSGNIVENAPGFAILVGRAARSMSVTGNLIRNVHIGIGVPIGIAETVPIAGNVISGANDGAIRAMDGPTPIGPDLADRFAAS